VLIRDGLSKCPFKIRTWVCVVLLLLHEQWGSVPSEQTINSERYVSITEEQRSCGYLTEDGATEHTANYFIYVSITMFEDRMISCPRGLPDLNPSDFYL
jgi:hypothetical protein